MLRFDWKALTVPKIRTYWFCLRWGGRKQGSAVLTPLKTKLVRSPTYSISAAFEESSELLSNHCFTSMLPVPSSTEYEMLVAFLEMFRTTAQNVS